MTTPLPIGLRRLMKLAEHLESGTLGHDRFNFSTIHVDRVDSDCKSVGCAMGELPFVFPKQWKFDRDDVVLRSGNTPAWGEQIELLDVADFFGIEEPDVYSLFYPGPKSVGYSGLQMTATRKQVARHIRRFVEGKVGK